MSATDFQGSSACRHCRAILSRQARRLKCSTNLEAYPRACFGGEAMLRRGGVASGHRCEKLSPGERPLWLYWETAAGQRLPPHIAICRSIIEYRCSDLSIRLVTPENLSLYLPELHPNIHQITEVDTGAISLGTKTLFIRAFLLEKFGGLYIDSDSIPLRSLASLFELIEQRGFLAIRRTSAPRRHISVGLLGARPENAVIRGYAAQLREHLVARTAYKWTEMGSELITPIVDADLSHSTILPEEYAHPVVAEKQWMFLVKDLEPADIVRAEAFIVMLFHRPFTGPSKAIPGYGIPASPKGWLHNWGLEDLYYGDILLSKLFRLALPRQEFQTRLPQMKMLIAG